MQNVTEQESIESHAGLSSDFQRVLQKSNGLDIRTKVCKLKVLCQERGEFGRAKEVVRMSERQQGLAENLRRVREGIARACERRGRDVAEVRLVAVTKTVDVETARMLLELGQVELGENRVQELAHKDGELGDCGVVWHMIGHLQTNKVRKVLPICGFIHAVDSLRLAQEISKRAGTIGASPEILLEVNVSGEEAKFGLRPEEVPEVAGEVGQLPGVKLVGLMTMAPFVDDAELTRPVFVRLRELSERIAGIGLAGVSMRHLSMGMTQDYEVAVEEGATLVRVGSALFRGLED